jgi:hypothetical protein
VKPKITRGHSVSLRVTAVGRPLIVAIEEGLQAMRDAGAPIDAEWTMGFHRGKEVGRNGDPYLEADYISLDATWAEQG